MDRERRGRKETSEIPCYKPMKHYVDEFGDPIFAKTAARYILCCRNHQVCRGTEFLQADGSVILERTKTIRRKCNLFCGHRVVTQRA